jgi:protein-disulfide isomerase
MSGKAWVIFGAVCVVLFGTLVIYSGRDRVDVSGIDANKIQTGSESAGGIADRVYGNKEAKVVVVEYGDFQCPGCKAAYPTLKSVKEKYEDQIAFVYRNFPLTNIHPNARAAAAAAEAAGNLGKYWEMHDILFENQDSWGRASTNERGDIFAGYAGQIGLDEAAFKNELDEKSAEINKKINFDIALGRKLNVTGTPSLFLNGEKIPDDNYSDQEALDKLILDALKEQGVEVPAEEEATATE